MDLSEQEQVVYLANLIAVARIDGRLASREMQVLETARKGVGARKSVTKKAELLAETPAYVPKPVGLFSVRVANLEDQIRTALADGPLTGQEQAALGNYAHEAGITDAQLKAMIAEIESVQVAEHTLAKCPSCETPMTEEAKFCPGCGNPVDKTDDMAGVSVSYELPTSGIAVEFAESTAAGFANALAKVQAAPSNATCVKDRKTWHMGAWPSDKIVDAAKLASDLKGMRNRKVWIDGKESRWDEVFGFVWCSEQREGAYRPIEYCFGIDDKRLNVWGCKQAHMEWVEWATWFSYGKFDKRGLLKKQITFTFDKKRIRHELESNLFRFRFCPYLNFRLVEAVVDAFPDEVMPETDDAWTYKRDYQESPGAIKIKEKTNNSGFSSVDEYYASGVVPRSSAVAVQILRKAAASIGVDQRFLEDVFKYES